MLRQTSSIQRSHTAEEHLQKGSNFIDRLVFSRLMQTLDGRFIVITGGSRGIGRALVESCIREGAFVGVNYLRSEVAAQELLAQYPDSIELLRFDVRDHNAATKSIRSFGERHGRIDAVVNNAGVFHARLFVANRELSGVPDEIGVNLFGTMICSQAALPFFLKTHRGVILNLSSCAVDHPQQGQSMYVSSKAGVEAFTRAIAAEYAGRGIRCLCVRLAPTDTEMLRGAGEAVYTSMAERTLLKRLSSPEEVGEFLTMLLTDSAAMTIGSVLDLTAGYSAR
jgi:3-oxoacyl-[acyl-carrier protein] reductase